MIINTSRSHQFKECEQKAYNWNELRLKAHREDSNLLIGGGLHKALALINAKKVNNLEEAAEAATVEFKERLGTSWDDLLKEEKTLYEEELSYLRAMVKVYGEHYLTEQYEMLAPEVTFRVPLPNSTHHCWYIHKILYPENLETRECTDQRCFQPHFFTGTTDAIIQWNRVIYLLEHKTTAYDLYNSSGQSRNYINAWQLNDQATGYLYGIWKQTKVRPHGVLLNVIIKPRKNAANPKFSFYREAFLRSEELLLRFERDIVLQANRYEEAMRKKEVTLNPASCYAYNRECYYRSMCKEQRGPLEGEFQPRSADYVEQGYYKILGIEPPAPEVPNV